jgi:hypothetical protein
MPIRSAAENCLNNENLSSLLLRAGKAIISWFSMIYELQL